MKFLILLILPMIMNTTIIIKSTAFKNNESIPEKYSCKGTNVNPPFSFSGIPSGAKSLALIMDDPDAPNGTFDHWIMWNIPVADFIDEGSALGTQGLNGRKENKYTGPCPPNGTHHYHFKIYALDIVLNLSEKADKKELEKAMEGHIIGKGELIGLFKK